jgi:hypothetical protein
MSETYLEDDSQEESTILPPDSDAMPPDHVGVLVAGVMMMIGGWAGIYQVVTTSLPRVGQRWLFFLLLQMAVTGTVLPFVRYLNVRFTPIDADLPPGGVLVRQSIWIGLFVVLCAWLQMPRVLNLPIAFFLGLVFVVIETFLRSREIRNERAE